jgi:Zn finger protein HypA/HybF involved in hydrogenase expression
MVDQATKKMFGSGARKIVGFHCEDCEANIPPQGDTLIEKCPVCGGNLYVAFESATKR